MNTITNSLHPFFFILPTFSASPAMRHHRISPAPSPHAIPPSPCPSPFLVPSSSPISPLLQTQNASKDTKLPVDFSPPLIAMVVIILTAFVIITYSRFLSRHLIHNYRRYTRWRHHRRRRSSTSVTDIESNPFDPTEAFHVLSPYGLDETIIKTIPISVYTRKTGFNECAVCLLEFDHNDYIRTLPVCTHAFHVDCIDIWLRSHANCPLCRAGIFRSDTPLTTPLMAARIRPALDDDDDIIVEAGPISMLNEIEHEIEIVSDERLNRRNFLLKRSYSFGFERNLGSERLVLEPVTASPWNRYRRRNGNENGSVSSFWNKRKFSFRYYRGIGVKSPFFRRRSVSGLYGGGGSSRRSNKSFASPMFMRPGNGGVFSSSRLRSGDPEALLSPERYRR